MLYDGFIRARPMCLWLVYQWACAVQGVCPFLRWCDVTQVYVGINFGAVILILKGVDCALTERPVVIYLLGGGGF